MDIVRKLPARATHRQHLTAQFPVLIAASGVEGGERCLDVDPFDPFPPFPSRPEQFDQIPGTLHLGGTPIQA
jgi:hypothetical protein